MALPLLSAPATAQPSEIPTQAPLPTISIEFVQPQKAPDFDKDVLIPLRAAQAAKAEQDKLDKIEADRSAEIAEEARLAEEAAELARLESTKKTAPLEPSQAVTPVAISGGLTGSYGYAHPGGNCVLEPGINNPGYGNPIDWPVLTQSPVIGSTALFWFNHTAVVTGFWSNGDIEVRHQNVWGGQTRYPRSAFRGFR